MSQILSIVLLIAQTAGTKLPLVWPHLLHIATDLKEIAKILGVTLDAANPRFLESAESAELKQVASDAGISEEDVNSVLEATSAIAQVE